MHNDPFTLTDENIVYVDTKTRATQHTMASFKLGSLELDVIVNASISRARRDLEMWTQLSALNSSRIEKNLEHAQHAADDSLVSEDDN